MVRQNKTSSSCKLKLDQQITDIEGTQTDVVHRNANEQLSGPVALVLSKEESALLEVIWVTGDSRILREPRLPITLS